MRYIALAVLLIGSGLGQAVAQTAAPSPTPAASPAAAATANPLPWTAYITPYAWVPNLNGQFNFNTPTRANPILGLPQATANLAVHVGPSSYLSHVNFVAMLSAYANRGDLSLGFDYVYLNLSSTDANVTNVTGPNGIVEIPINVSTSAHLRGSLLTLDAGQRLTQNQISPIEIFGGARYLVVTSSADWNFAGPLDILNRSGSVSRDLHVWDPLVGLRGKIGFGPNWSLPYYVDFGAGTNNTTHQEYVGFAYSQHWGDIFLLNRWLQYNFTSPNINSFQLVGPTLGVRIRLK
jgi:hypothetical protein